MKTHSYEHARGLHLGTTYTVVDGTAETSARSFNYNHLGQLTQLVDDSGTHTFGYNAYGETESDSFVVDGDTHIITEIRDNFGRSTGYTYAKNGTAQQTVCAGYGDDGRICSAGFLHGGEAKNFGYTYLAGTNLLQVLTKPNGMTLTQTYETTRNLLTGMAYHRGSTLVAQREYTYDILGRPIARNTSRQGLVVNDTFTNNTRSELVDATVSGKDYEYVYDNIGNRLSSMEDNVAVLYDTNELNQYVSVSENGAAAFEPQFDADGNQTLIKTSTGIWSTVYNAENRPVSFTNADTGTVVECAYDSTGRRAYKKVIVNSSVTLHQRYVYRGYLQIACIDLTRSHHPVLWFITWDPTQQTATRPLAIRINGSWYTYGWDLTKNICELYGTTGYVSTSYNYSPFGKVANSGNVTQPIQWSSEIWDEEMGLMYYNWRYYNPNDGRWLSYDPEEENEELNLKLYCKNSPIDLTDILGLASYKVDMRLCKLNVRLTWKISFVNDQNENGKWTKKSIKRWKLKMQDVAETYFDSYKNKYRCVSKSKCCKKCKNGLRVKFDLSYVNTNADYNIVVHYDNYFRSYVDDLGGSGIKNIGGELSRIDNQVYEYEDAEGNKYNQISGNHEIGHMLGLVHLGAKLPNPPKPNSYADYEADAASLMGLGNILRKDDFQTAFCSHAPAVEKCSNWQVKSIS